MQALYVKEGTIVDIDNSTAEIDFSKFLLDDIYIIQQEAIAKLWLRKNNVAHQEVT